MELKQTDYQVRLLALWVKQVGYAKLGAKTTVCLLTVNNGFEIVGTSACVNPADYNEEIGKHWALKDALDKLDELVGFYLQFAQSKKDE